MIKNRLLMQETEKIWFLSLGWEDPLEEGGNGNPLQYSCLENFMDRGAWWAPAYGVTKESDAVKHACTYHTIYTFKV